MDLLTVVHVNVSVYVCVGEHFCMCVRVFLCVYWAVVKSWNVCPPPPPSLPSLSHPPHHALSLLYPPLLYFSHVSPKSNTAPLKNSKAAGSTMLKPCHTYGLVRKRAQNHHKSVYPVPTIKILERSRNVAPRPNLIVDSTSLHFFVPTPFFSQTTLSFFCIPSRFLQSFFPPKKTDLLFSKLDIWPSQRPFFWALSSFFWTLIGLWDF